MPQDNKPLRRYGGGPLLQELTQTHLNETQDAVDGLRKDFSRNVAYPGLNNAAPDNYILAVVVQYGPRGKDSDPEPTGNTYWIKMQKLKSNMTPLDETAPGMSIWAKATNLAEASDSRTLNINGTCLVKVYKREGSNWQENGALIFHHQPTLALLGLLPGQIGVFNGALRIFGPDSDPRERDIDTKLFPQDFGLPFGGSSGYRATIIRDASGTGPTPFANENGDARPDDPTKQFKYNAIYFNLDEPGIISNRDQNPLNPNAQYSSGKWLTDNRNTEFISADPNVFSPNAFVLGFRVGTTTDGRGVYVGTGGLSSTNYVRLTSGNNLSVGGGIGLQDIWQRGGVNREDGLGTDGFGNEQSGLSTGGAEITLTNHKTGDVYKLRFDASGKAFLIERTDQSTDQNIAYTPDNPPP